MKNLRFRNRHVVLCVDDEQPVLDAIRRALRREPYKVITTADALQALGWVETREVSLVIIDQNMPIRGTELLMAVREFSPNTACIVLTGRPDGSVIAGRLRGRVQRLLTKPWNDWELRSAVRTLLHEVEVRSELDFKEGIRELIDRAGAAERTDPPAASGP